MPLDGNPRDRGKLRCNARAGARIGATYGVLKVRERQPMATREPKTLSAASAANNVRKARGGVS